MTAYSWVRWLNLKFRGLGRRAEKRPSRRIRPRVEALEDRNLLSVYHVLTTADGLGTVTQTSSGQFNATTLRAAVIAANNVAGADTIVLPAGNYTLTLSGSGEDFAQSGDLDLRDGVTIRGTGASQTFINGSLGLSKPATDRIFQVIGPNTNVTLQGITVRNGQISDLSGSQGGGILSQGILTVVNCVITGNHADGFSGGEGFGATGQGGGIFNEGGAQLTLRGSKVTNNQASGVNGRAGQGGGILNQAGTLSLIQSTVSGNRATGGSSSTAFASGGAGQGGGLFEEAGSATITASTIANNFAIGGGVNGALAAIGGQAQGGGIFDNGDPITIANSTVSGNQAVGGNATLTQGNQGGFAGGHAQGGGVDNEFGDLTIRNSTFSGNRVTGGNTTVGGPSVSGGQGGDALGGAIFSRAGQPGDAILNSTIVLNRAVGGDAGGSYGGTGFGGGVFSGGEGSPVGVLSTIIAGNTADRGPDVSGNFTGNDGNLIGNPSGASGIGGSGDFTFASLHIQNINQVLDPTLRNNGGSTLTHALVNGSPAINRGSNPAGLNSDQRGHARTQGGATDIGAVEFDIVAPPTTSPFGGRRLPPPPS